MKKFEIEAKIELFSKELEHLKRIKINCQNCEFYQQSLCGKFQAAPPTEVLAVGCDEFNFDEIPF